MTEELTSIAELVDNEWTVTSTEFPDLVTRGLWLEETITDHREALRRRSHAPLQLHYRVAGHNIDGDVKRVRDAQEWLNETYRVAKTFDITTRPERYALLERLAEEKVMPSEMVLMLGVDVKVAERFAGDDDEARISRRLLHRMSTTKEGIRA